jgi:hypothetical protein
MNYEDGCLPKNYRRQWNAQPLPEHGGQGVSTVLGSNPVPSQRAHFRAG